VSGAMVLNSGYPSAWTVKFKKKMKIQRCAHRDFESVGLASCPQYWLKKKKNNSIGKNDGLSWLTAIILARSRTQNQLVCDFYLNVFIHARVFRKV
jgi:hypothetical protein